MDKLRAKTTGQLFEATVNLEFDYFIKSLEEDVSIAEFGERISIKDAHDNGLAVYFDHSCIFTVTPADVDTSLVPIPKVERFYLNCAFSNTDGLMKIPKRGLHSREIQ